jgi:bifunctional DNA-binding transcriptional regulator/antitoxin component of YhaV-PrlF toxin-antitoxin module
VIPADIRKRHGIRDGDHLIWLDDGQTMQVIPTPADPVRALRGSGKGQRLGAKLLEARQSERDVER